jgi:hypothetical protein
MRRNASPPPRPAKRFLENTPNQQLLHGVLLSDTGLIESAINSGATNFGEAIVLAAVRNTPQDTTIKWFIWDIIERRDSIPEMQQLLRVIMDTLNFAGVERDVSGSLMPVVEYALVTLDRLHPRGDYETWMIWYVIFSIRRSVNYPRFIIQTLDSLIRAGIVSADLIVRAAIDYNEIHHYNEIQIVLNFLGRVEDTKILIKCLEWARREKHHHIVRMCKYYLDIREEDDSKDDDSD